MHRQQTSLTVVRCALPRKSTAEREIPIHADRMQLEKLRWRATAEDGRDFGFDVDTPLRHGDIICANDYHDYVINQLPEPVLVLNIEDTEARVRISWFIGNLHQLLQINGNVLITADDPALRHLFDQQHTAYVSETRRFEPLRSTAHHHHDHAH